MTAGTLAMKLNVKNNTIYFQDNIQYTYKIKSIAEFENMKQTGMRYSCIEPM
jgi:hypothetical protein